MQKYRGKGRCQATITSSVDRLAGLRLEPTTSTELYVRYLLSGFYLIFAPYFYHVVGSHLRHPSRGKYRTHPALQLQSLLSSVTSCKADACLVELIVLRNVISGVASGLWRLSSLAAPKSNLSGTGRSRLFTDTQPVSLQLAR